jgi:hypothetical protein
MHPGEELKMTVGANVQYFAHVKDLAIEVIDLTALGRINIRVTYRPKLVGARELLSIPILQPARLAPPTAQPSHRTRIALTGFSWSRTRWTGEDKGSRISQLRQVK